MHIARILLYLAIICVTILCNVSYAPSVTFDLWTANGGQIFFLDAYLSTFFFKNDKL